MRPLITIYLEMRSPEQLRPKHADARFQIREEKGDWRFNRDLYFAVGERWDWTDKRPWTEAQWKEYAAAPELRTFAAYYGDALAGYYELRRESEPDGRNAAVEIAYFGLLPEFIGRGLGGALLTSAIEEAWLISPKRVWVHTCNRDHPQALANYQARGMVVYKIEEIAG
jgi:GNAT superfamily N-acetyltransferase